MNFRNKKHADRFFTAIHDNKIGTEDTAMLAAVYVLTCRKKVWDRFKDHIINGGTEIEACAFAEFQANNPSENAIVTAAFDVLYGTDSIAIEDFCDDSTIPDDAFWAIMYMICYYRMGFDDCPVKDISDIKLN